MNDHGSDAWAAPDDIWEVSKLRFDEALDGERDPRWVDTSAARGSYQLQRLYRRLGVEASDGPALKSPREKGYFLFCGHRGCGKSTELRRIRNELDHPDLYYVVFADAAQELDVNNLRYQDILFHIAGKLMERLEENRIGIDRVHLRSLEKWFSERVVSQEETKAFATDVTAGARVEPTIPFLAKAFGQISTANKTNTTYKEALRRTLQNYFTEFAQAFNHLIEAARGAVQESAKGRGLLFVVDGTDMLRDEDARAFFERDVHQLQQVYGLFLYCAPIHLIYENVPVGQDFDHIFKLPMIKVRNADGSRNEAGFSAMREMLHRRASPSLFDAGVADYLIEHSGGHARDLLRLLLGAFEHGSARFSQESVRSAVRDAANVFRRTLQEEDYETLARLDSLSETPPHNDQTRNLLYNLALLEYNDYFCRSHPVIRTTEAYRAAQGRIGSAAGE